VSSDTEIKRRTELNAAPRCVLFVEDNVDDYSLACRDLQKVFLRNRTLRVSNADEMLEYLRSMDSYLDIQKFPIPAVIIMDQNLAGAADGIEAQTMLRASLGFRDIPIVAISGPDQIPRLRSAAQLGADAWMTKPFNGAEFRHICLDLRLPLQFGTAESPK
jgi:CheY-like chemotaxis protein